MKFLKIFVVIVADNTRCALIIIDETTLWAQPYRNRLYATFIYLPALVVVIERKRNNKVLSMTDWH